MKPPLLSILLLVIGVALSLFLGGCNGGPSVLRGDGVPTVGPYGFYEYCQRHPEVAECGGAK
jgi:hypothetical protein